MKIKQSVEIKFSSAYCSWSGLEVNDGNGNEVLVLLSDKQWLSLGDLVASKCKRIKEERLKEAREEIEQASASEEG